MHGVYNFGPYQNYPTPNAIHYHDFNDDCLKEMDNNVRETILIKGYYNHGSWN